MALITTPGEGCESLCTVAEANDYHDKRGNTAQWAPLENLRKEQLLRQAYDWLYGRYWARWPEGEPFGAVTGVPDPIITNGARNACAQLALYALAGPLDGEPEAQVIKQKVGPIEQEFAEKPADAGRKFPDVARMMAPYLATVNPYSVPLRRA